MLFKWIKKIPDLEVKCVLSKVFVELFLAGIEVSNLSRTSPFLERRKNEAKRKQTAAAREIAKSKLDPRTAVIERRANAIWEGQPHINGNANRTANAIVDDVQIDLKILGCPYDSRDKAVAAIRKRIVKVNRWKIVDKTESSVQRSS